MNQFWQINRRHITYLFLLWLVVANVLVFLVHKTDWWFLQVLLFLSLALLPGLILLRNLRITFSSFTTGILYGFALSIFLLMLSGLIANQLHPMFQLTRPLEAQSVLLVWNGITIGLLAASWRHNKQAVHFKRWLFTAMSKASLTMLIFSLLLPVLACFGAFRLNNGGDALFAFLTLIIAGGMIAGIFLLRHRLSDGTLAWLIFSIGLSVLLMTSLRGWDIVGHDIQREFRVYTLTHLHAYWDIALDRDPYNACLSITILPEVIGRILHVSGLIVFKFILQIIFAACAATIYLLLRQYTSKLGSCVGVVLFICYPTFINDSAMLTRQGVAYFFFALALLAMMRRPLLWQHKVLFLLMALGAILSHYSTAYMFVALFGVAVFGKYMVRFYRRFFSKNYRYERPTLLSPWYAGLLFFMTFVWYTQITETSTGLFVTVQKSLANITNIFSDDNKSADTSTALFFANNKTTANLYQSYLSHANVSAERAGSDYLPTLLSDTLPLTSLGKKAQSIGIDPSFIGFARQNFARILQVLALAGVGFAVYKYFKRRPGKLPADMVFLCVSALVILALLTLLPVVSVNYGILRAFQQSLIFLIIPIVLFLAVLGRRLRPKIKIGLVMTSMVFLFYLFTGVFAQLLGGSSPSFSMNNQGLYYGLYYSPAVDRKAFEWLRHQIPKKGDVRAANFNRAFMHDPDYPFNRSGILPSQIRSTSFIYADEAQVKTQRFYTYYDSSPLIMSFPLEYYDVTKNIIYSTTSTRVYR